MPIDYKSFRKLESMPPSTQEKTGDDGEDLLVLVKLRSDGRLPDYVSPRAEMGPRMFSAQIKAGLLKQLESDPNVETVSISRQTPLMK
jgi:hypothetical protein